MASATIPSSSKDCAALASGRTRVMKLFSGQSLGTGLSALAALFCLSWQGVETDGTEHTAADPTSEVVFEPSLPFAVASPTGGFDLWHADESSGATYVSVTGIEFLPVRGAGMRFADGMRTDVPTVRGEGTPTPHVRLAGRGNLYRVSRGGKTGLLHVDNKGNAQMMLEVPDADGVPGLLETVAISMQSDSVLVASPVASGGDVWAIDLGEPRVHLLTGNHPPHAVEPTSLRIHRRSAWFVAGGELFGTPTPFHGTIYRTQTELPGPVLPDLVLSLNGRRVAALHEESHLMRRIVVHSSQGTHTVVTPLASEFFAANYEHPRGPFMALSADGSMVAFLHAEAPYHGKWTQELYVREVDIPMASVHVTQAPDFPVYIDNVGILGFVHGKVITFFGGDQTISGIPAAEGMGASDRFAADYNVPEAPVVQNLTRSSGQLLPPYDIPGQLDFVSAQVDPRGERYLLRGDADFLGGQLKSFALDDAKYDSVAVDLVEDVASDVVVRDAGYQVFVITQPLPEAHGPDYPAPPGGGESPDDDGKDDDDCGDLAPEVDMLLPLDESLGDTLPVYTLYDDLSLDRFVGLQELSAAVLSLGPGAEYPVFIDGVTGILSLAWMMPEEVSPRLTVTDSQRLLFGHGPQGGPYQFVSVGRDGSATMLGVPPGYGFPLPR